MKSKRMRLTKEERENERDNERGLYVDAPKELTDEIVEMLKRRKKDAILSIRINSIDLARVKQKASKLGVRYQSYIAELIHRAVA